VREVYPDNEEMIMTGKIDNSSAMFVKRIFVWRFWLKSCPLKLQQSNLHFLSPWKLLAAKWVYLFCAEQLKLISM